MAGIPASAKPVLLLIVAAAIGLTFTVFRDSVGALAVVIVWAGIFLSVFGFYAFGRRKEALSSRKRDERPTTKIEPASVDRERKLAEREAAVKDREDAVAIRENVAALHKERLEIVGEVNTIVPVHPEPETNISSLLASGHSQICSPGPHNVDPGSFTRIELNVAPGMRVTGRLEEIDSQPFDWVILQETELVKFQRRQRPRVVLSGHDEPAYAVEWIVEARGPWFLVLDGYGKKTRRKVGTHLR